MRTLIKLFVVLPIKLLMLPLKALGALLRHPKLALGAVALGAAAAAAADRDR